eukprot:4160208-Heterocapsa_arctica.AAC.1
MGAAAREASDTRAGSDRTVLTDAASLSKCLVPPLPLCDLDRPLGGRLASIIFRLSSMKTWAGVMIRCVPGGGGALV